MAYEPTVWKNRVVERPLTFNIVNNPDGTVTLVPAPGVIVESGTPVNAVNLNKLEQGLKTHEADYAKHKRTAVGSYMGDGTTGRMINVGFTPAFVYIRLSDITSDFYLNNEVSAMRHTNGMMFIESEVKIVANGFRVGGATALATANGADKLHYYVAME
jgi:hypothetical protein